MSGDLETGRKLFTLLSDGGLVGGVHGHWGSLTPPQQSAYDTAGRLLLAWAAGDDTPPDPHTCSRCRLPVRPQPVVAVTGWADEVGKATCPAGGLHEVDEAAVTLPDGWQPAST